MIVCLSSESYPMLTICLTDFPSRCYTGWEKECTIVACITEVAQWHQQIKNIIRQMNLTHPANVSDSEVNNRNRLQEGCSHEDSTWLQDTTYLSHLHTRPIGRVKSHGPVSSPHFISNTHKLD